MVYEREEGRKGGREGVGALELCRLHHDYLYHTFTFTRTLPPLPPYLSSLVYSFLIVAFAGPFYPAGLISSNQPNQSSVQSASTFHILSKPGFFCFLLFLLLPFPFPPLLDRESSKDRAKGLTEETKGVIHPFGFFSQSLTPSLPSSFSNFSPGTTPRDLAFPCRTSPVIVHPLLDGSHPHTHTTYIHTHPHTPSRPTTNRDK